MSLLLFGYPAYRYYSSSIGEVVVERVEGNNVYLKYYKDCGEKKLTIHDVKSQFMKNANVADRIELYYNSCNSNWVWVPKLQGKGLHFVNVVIVFASFYGVIEAFKNTSV